MKALFHAPVLALSLAAAAIPASAATDLVQVVTGLDAPVAITHANDARIFISQLGGLVRVVEDGQLLPAPFLDITDRVSSRGGYGLWSIAFHPDYPATPYLFANYTEKDTEDSLVARFEVLAGAEQAAADSELILLRIPKDVRLHYGGQLAFGPDGYLYSSLGDGTDATVGPDPLCLAQRLDNLEGKLMRIDVDNGADSPPYYSIPEDNPFAGGSFGEIWGYGLRNPWRFSFDRENGDLWLSDVGQDQREEVTWTPAGSPGGANYGWKIMEGSQCFGNVSGCGLVGPCPSSLYTLPTIEYDHGSGRCSVIGGYVYRGSLVPELYGRYLYADYCTGEIRSAELSGASTLLDASLTFTNTFGEGFDGEIYMAGQGTLFRLVDPNLPAAGVVEFAVTSLEVAETDGSASVEVRRVGDGQGAVSVEVATTGGTATAGSDYAATTATFNWSDGELGARTFTVPIFDDSDDEAVETFQLEASAPTGGAILGARQAAQITVLDDDGCIPSDTQMCLNDERFRVSISWRTEDEVGDGRKVELTEDAGFFWFFSEDNPEIFVKILDACVEPFNHYWVFLAGLTNVETRIEVVDTGSGELKVYETALGEGFEAVRDTTAFATCP